MREGGRKSGGGRRVSEGGREGGGKGGTYMYITIYKLAKWVDHI